MCRSHPHLQEAKDTDEFENPKNADKLDHLGGLEQPNQTSRAVGQNHVPWQRGHDVNGQETPSIVHGNLVLGSDQDISLIRRQVRSAEVQKNVQQE